MADQTVATPTAEKSATERAGDTAKQATDQTKRVKDAAVEQAAGVAQEAKGKAVDVVGQARRQLGDETDAQATRLAGALQDVSRQLSAMGASGEPGPVRELTGQAAGALATFAERLDNRGVQGVLDDVSRFARRRPGAFLLGAGVAGFVVTRLVKVSASAQAISLATPDPTPGNDVGQQVDPDRG